MADRRHGVRSRARSPPPRSRDFSPSRHRGREDYDYSRRIEKRDNPGRNFSPRVSDHRGQKYSRRIEKRDGSFSGGGLGVSDSSHSRHHQYLQTEKRDYEDRDFRLVSEYDGRDRDIHVGGDRLYGSPRRISSPPRTDTLRYTRFPDYEYAGRFKNKDVVNDGHQTRLQDEGLYRQNLSFNQVGERDYYYYYPHNRYLDSASQYPNSTTGVSFKYEREERKHPRSFTLPVTNLSSHQFPSLDLNADASKLHLHDDQGCFLEKKKDWIGYLEGFLGMGGEERYGFPSSQDYLKRDSNYTLPSYQPRDYVSGFRGYSNTVRDNNVLSHMSGFDSRRIGSTSTRFNDVGEDNRVLHVSRNDAVDECFHKKDDRQCEHKASRLLYGRNQELGSSHLNFGFGPESTVESGQCSLVQPRGYDPDPDPLFGRYYESPRNKSGLVDLILDEPFERRRQRNKHLGDEMMCGQDAGIRISVDGNGARKIYKGIEFLDFSKKPKSSEADYEETCRGSGHMENDRPTSSIFHPSRFSSADIKKRLGPVPHKLHVSQRLMKKYKRQKKRAKAKLPWIKNLSSNVSTSVEDSYGSHCDYERDHPPLAKPEPPEKSKDFKQLVQTAFFKFLKQISETPMKRKMYLEQGKGVSLKCMVCGSDSEEYSETETLARHALSSKKAGVRSQHLGLHKAVCVVMGWKSEVDLGSEWVSEVMSDAGASAVKEDLIIWPPVVIVYNSGIESCDELDKKLRDMGFGSSIVKVCSGNKSVMVVRFNGTLSGLQEAERCYKSYLDRRSEGKQLNPAERGVYAHLGIVDDVDKLDFDTKKRCVIRSKKEILGIMNNPLGEG